MPQPNTARIALIGDFGAAITAHQAIPLALALAAKAQGITVDHEWIATETVGHVTHDRLAAFDGIWCVPGSPYRNMDGALAAIAYARTRAIPYLGTCGGYQHALIEYARNVLGMADADHAESNPGSTRPIVSALACALVEANNRVRFAPGFAPAGLVMPSEMTARYRCSYGLNPDFAHLFAQGDLRIVAHDTNGIPQAIALDSHPFFVGTAYQPERDALADELNPLIDAFVRATLAPHP
ncbi:MAG: hypothetical protein JO142_00860 [Burkholderiales bacterium]|nr:hypothetical protein [Burkholderiales bacterium]